MGVTRNKPTALGRKFDRVLARLQGMPGLDEHERILFARSLAATPTQRWQIHNNTRRSLGFFLPSAKNESGS